MSLYADLGVDPDASGDELRKAHRRQVQNTHPDKGGNREDFEKVQHAYMILRDPKTRSRYDETGEHDVQPDNELAEVGNILVGAFDQAMQEAQGRFDVSDLIAGTRKILEKRKREAEANKGIMADAVKNFVKVRDRLSFKGGGCRSPRVIAQCQDIGGRTHGGRICTGDRDGRACRRLRGGLRLSVRSSPFPAELSDNGGAIGCAA